MQEYLIILKILVEVINGKNLTERFAHYTNSPKATININRIKDVCYGVLRYYWVQKNLLDHLATKGIKDQQLEVILLIGLYEINYTNRPQFAIVNEIVNLTYKAIPNSKVKNFVNATLRNYLRNREILNQQFLSYPEYKYNIPLWWINKLKSDYPDNYEDILVNLVQKPNLSLRINSAKINLTEYAKLLDEAGISYSIVDGVIILTNLISIDKLPGFNLGYVSVQDVNAQKLLELLTIPKGSKVLDACCAPGGKLCQMLENSQSQILGIDISNERLLKVQQNLARLNLNAELKVGDASKLDWWDNNQFDIVIADVPCSASGTLKRNPDIKLHRKPSDIHNFVKTQRKIILNLWPTLKIGGKLLYITCSIFKEENQGNIQFLLSQLDGANMLRELQLLPTVYSDGFYYCVLEKMAK